MIVRVAMAFALLLGMAPVDAMPSPNVSKGFAELMKISLENIAPAERDRKMEAVLQPLQSEVNKVSLPHLADADVKEWFEVVHLVAAYTMKPRYAELMRGAIDEMARRRMEIASQQRVLMTIYVTTRMLDEAHAYAASLNGIDATLPRFEDEAISDETHPTLWYVSGDASSVLRYSFPLDEGVKVVVSGHPWCHFSRNAAKDIETNAKLAALMQRYATWVVPQHPMPNFSDIAQWNAQHPQLPMRVAYLAQEWRDITSWATPIFYFFKDGRLIDSVTGWPGLKQGDKLIEAFHTLGVGIKGDE